MEWFKYKWAITNFRYNKVASLMVIFCEKITFISYKTESILIDYIVIDTDVPGVLLMLGNIIRNLILSRPK